MKNQEIRALSAEQLQEQLKSEKQQLQKLIFPDGIYYCKKKDTCRIGRVNAVFLCMSQLAVVLGGNKKGETSSETNFPVFVVRAGVEPATHGFSVHCSTN